MLKMLKMYIMMLWVVWVAATVSAMVSGNIMRNMRMHKMKEMWMENKHKMQEKGCEEGKPNEP
ncbi:MAG: hypothetical protein SA339_09425 [Methanomassiliicoccus sp.]|nr:hypothetical protein [Methanomassiliicoccus sp.]